MASKNGEVRDVPFLKNDMKNSPPTTGKPLNTADEPGKADAEMGQEGGPPPRKVDADDALIQEPRDDVFRDR